MLTDIAKPVPSPGLVPESQHWRARAREFRVLADRSRLDFARERFLKAADDCERNALDAAEREITRGISRIGDLVRDLHRAGESRSRSLDLRLQDGELSCQQGRRIEKTDLSFQTFGEGSDRHSARGARVARPQGR
jgi:hypothetical protein